MPQAHRTIPGPAPALALLRDRGQAMVRPIADLLSRLEACGEQGAGVTAAPTTPMSGARPTPWRIVRDVMEPHPAVLEDEPMMRAVHEILEHHLGGEPVTDRYGELVGELSEADVLAWQVRTLRRFAPADQPHRLEDAPAPDRETVHDAMTRPPISIDETAPLDAALALFPTGGIGRLLVTHRGRLVGVLTRSTVLRALARA